MLDRKTLDLAFNEDSGISEATRHKMVKEAFLDLIFQMAKNDVRSELERKIFIEMYFYSLDDC